MPRPLNIPTIAGRSLDRPELTPYQALVGRWHGCQRCHLSDGRRRVVMARGTVPCEVLFVGEAPGESEDRVSGGTPGIGQPFVGPAGKLMDHIIERALGGPGDPGTPPYALFNLVGCIPKDDEGNKSGAPDDEAVRACMPRLQDFVRICDDPVLVLVNKDRANDPNAPPLVPTAGRLRLIVCVGGLARDWLDQTRGPLPGARASSRPPTYVRLHRPIPQVHILHPSYILSKLNVAQRGLAIQRAVVIIHGALEGFNGG
jgi:uracil-DNA glycosylase family 4